MTRRGEPIESSLEAMAALIAGSFAATKELARLLGEEEFTTMFHQSQRENIQISLVGQRSGQGSYRSWWCSYPDEHRRPGWRTA